MPKVKKRDSKSGSQNLPVILEEYKALRAEIIKRIEIRYQVINYLLIVSGTFLSVGIQPTISPSILLIYPLLAMFLAYSWAHNGLVIRQIGRYIKENIEQKHPSIQWESSHNKDYPFTRLGRISTSGLVLITQVLAIALGIIKLEFTLIESVLLILSVSSILLTIRLLRAPYR
ncbi:MAG: hypothetical protein MHPDNHAH_02959 [Anaerolineales bacterium]|nr:hypothetical protein [Anaerolineales bacterium]